MDKNVITLIVIGYLLIMTVVGMVVMYSDKAKARAHQWRTKEATLFLVCAIGGSLGTCLGMYIFRHKTKHWYFVVGMPLILVVHICIIAALFYFKILAL